MNVILKVFEIGSVKHYVPVEYLAEWQSVGTASRYPRTDSKCSTRTEIVLEECYVS